MKIFIAADHAGYEQKETLKPFLTDLGHEVEDCGAFSFDPEDDYPEFMRACAENVVAHPGSFGIIGGGSGNGEAIMANRVPGARAAVFHGRTNAQQAIDATGATKSDDGFDIVRLSRKHNDANILSLGFRFISEEELTQAVQLFIETPFEGGRHARRVAKLG